MTTLVRPARALALGVVAVACGMLGYVLVAHYPLAPYVAASVYVLWLGVAAAFPRAWLFIVPAALPVIGYASWTGWLTFEEFDALTLGAAAGGYLAAAAHPPSGMDPRDLSYRWSPISIALVGLFGASSMWALHVGMASVGGEPFGWFQGYHDRLNSLRVFKSFALAALLWPLMRDQLRRAQQSAINQLSAGLCAGCAMVSVAVLWERIAFPGMLNFSEDYRATGMFWEMHVGGAALDGFLALTAPFAIRQWRHARSATQMAAIGGLLALIVYACLVTFSRGLYIALLVSMIAPALFIGAQPRALSANSLGVTKAFKLGGMAAFVALASFLAFRHGGYRALAAMLGVVAVGLPIAADTRSVAAPRLLAVAAAGASIGAMVVVLAMQLEKGVYALFALLFASCLLLLWRQRGANSDPWKVGAIAAISALAVSSVGVGWYWGGADAGADATMAVLLVTAVIIYNARSARFLFSDNLRQQITSIGAATLIAAVVAVFSGGAYMDTRFSSSGQDLELRLAHWRHVVQLLRTPDDWLFGKGLGRFPSTYFYNVDNGDFPGSFRLEEGDGKRYLVLSGPRHPTGFGELFRVSQRVLSIPHVNYSVTLHARAPRDVVLHLEICEKHLLYPAGCANQSVVMKASPILWQPVVVPLDGREIGDGPWYAPRLAFFSIAVASAGERVELDDVTVRADDGTQLIVNGDFSAGLSRWFFTSDRDHLPWHAKNLALNVLIDQGAVGLGMFVLLVSWALWRLVVVAHCHADAPYIASALVGFLVVGVFDSLLDVPRVAFLFYLLLFVALILPRDGAPQASSGTAV